jgi:hypothetical protein
VYSQAYREIGFVSWRSPSSLEFGIHTILNFESECLACVGGAAISSARSDGRELGHLVAERRPMKITLAAAALAILILPASGLAQTAPGAPNAQSGAPAIPGPAEDLPTGVLPGSELSDWTAQYPETESFCGDDIVSRHICQPGGNFSQVMADRMCQSVLSRRSPAQYKTRPRRFSHC